MVMSQLGFKPVTTSRKSDALTVSPLCHMLCVCNGSVVG